MGNSINLHKVKRIMMSEEYFLDIITTGKVLRVDNVREVVVVDGVPENSTIINWGYDPRSNTNYIIVHNESFEIVPDGSEIPVFRVKMSLKSIMFESPITEYELDKLGFRYFNDTYILGDSPKVLKIYWDENNILHSTYNSESIILNNMKDVYDAIRILDI